MIRAPQQTSLGRGGLPLKISPVALQTRKCRFVNDADDAFVFHSDEIGADQIVMRHVDDAVAGKCAQREKKKREKNTSESGFHARENSALIWVGNEIRRQIGGDAACVPREANGFPYRKMGRDRACPSKRLAAGLLGFGFVVVWTRCAIESTAFQQRLDVGIAPGEIFEQAESIGRSTTREQRFSKAIAVFAFQSAVLLNPLDAVGIEHFAPEIRIISGRVSAGESMRKIKAAVTRRHRWKIDSGLVERFLFKHDSIRRNPRWIELMPG